MSHASLHHRLNRRLVVGIAALLVIFGSALGWLFVTGLTRELDRSLQTKAQAAAGLSASEAVSLASFSDIDLPDGRKGRQVVIDFAARSDGADTSPEVSRVIATEPRSSLAWTIVRFSLILACFFGFLLLAEALLVRNAVRRGLEPVEGLRRQLQILDPTHRGQRVSLQAPPEELAPILQRINDLLEKADVPLAEQRTAAR
jgi:hypothetical protein